MNLSEFFSQHKTSLAVSIVSSALTVIILSGAASAALVYHRAAVLKFLLTGAFPDHQSASGPQSTTSQADNTGAMVNDVLNKIAGLQKSVDASNPELSTVQLVKKVKPAVVSIIITKEVPVYEQYNQNINPFQDVFGQGTPFNITVPQLRQNGTQKQEVGGGTGFFVSADGLIVTNRHVVSDTSAEYTVITNDGKKYTAAVVARDPVLDVAVIKITGSNFPYLAFGNSDTLEVGQTVVAVGNALGEFKNTVSVGIVSGLSRSIMAGDNATGSSEQLDQVIQTDAAINPGNSGGPLVDSRGMVIGISVAVAQGGQNIGFALPINSVKSVIESVKKTGKIIHPYLGIRYVPITPDIKQKNSLPVDYGALVVRGSAPDELAVLPGSPADKAGIAENDIILEMDGVKLDENNQLSLLVRNKKVGDTLHLKIVHKGETKDVEVKLEAMPQS